MAVQQASIQEIVAKLDVYKDIFENLYDGVIMVDRQGIIIMISDAYCRFLGIKKEDALGKHVTEVIENTRLHIVAETGQAEIGSLLKVKGQNAVVVRIPIWKNNEVEGVVGKVLFRNVSELESLAMRLKGVESKLAYYRTELKRIQGAKYSFQQIIGKSLRMQDVLHLAKRAAKTKSTVLIRGESGTGKELFAHAIHEASPRSEGPFVRLNCATIPKQLMEAELFGYAEGTFTGAIKGGRAGKIEIASGGTLFLDEIGDMPLDMQVKLLRFLQEKEVQRLGEKQIKQVDVRVIAATNRNLEEMIKKGQFREDLYYRLNVVSLTIPPLRERVEDIIITAQYIIGKLNMEMGTAIAKLEPEVKQLFKRYPWPGNVRELHNIIERALNVVDGTTIGVKHLPLYLQEWAKDENSSINQVTSNLLAYEVEKAEKRAILHALQRCQGNRSKAAELLGIHRTSLYRKLEQYGLDKELKDLTMND